MRLIPFQCPDCNRSWWMEEPDVVWLERQHALMFCPHCASGRYPRVLPDQPEPEPEPIPLDKDTTHEPRFWTWLKEKFLGP